MSSRRYKAVADAVLAILSSEAGRVATVFGTVVALGSGCLLVTLMFPLDAVALANGCSISSQSRTYQGAMPFEGPAWQVWL